LKNAEQISGGGAYMPSCGADGSNRGQAHAITKAGLRISVKDYPRHKARQVLPAAALAAAARGLSAMPRTLSALRRD
jgi:hypothetical protein